MISDGWIYSPNFYRAYAELAGGKITEDDAVGLPVANTKLRRMPSMVCRLQCRGFSQPQRTSARQYGIGSG